jgi:hypothetical protein
MKRQADRPDEFARAGRPIGTRHAGSPNDWRREFLQLQRSAGNSAVSELLTAQMAKSMSGRARDSLQRQVAAPPSMDPKVYPSYGAWLQALPADAVDANAVDVTDEVKVELPDLASLVVDLKADCADVSILLRHYYLQAHNETGTLKSINTKDIKNPIKYPIGAGVTKAQLKNVLSSIGTTNFQDNKNRFAFINYYGGASRTQNLKKLLAAGLGPGDLLIWKRLSGITGNFDGHVQTIQSITPAYLVGPGKEGPEQEGSIEVLQGTMEAGVAKGEIQSKVLTFFMLTGTRDGNADISLQPSGEEEFYGAGKW